MARTCYICGARKRNLNSLTCGFISCREEHLRRYPALQKKSFKESPNLVDRGRKRAAILYDDQLEPYYH